MSLLLFSGGGGDTKQQLKFVLIKKYYSGLATWEHIMMLLKMMFILI